MAAQGGHYALNATMLLSERLQESALAGFSAAGRGELVAMLQGVRANRSTAARTQAAA